MVGRRFLQALTTSGSSFIIIFIFALSLCLPLLSSHRLEAGKLVHRVMHHASTSQLEIRKEEKVMIRGGQIGSEPPRCQGRCRSCGHCQAIQVPTNSHLPTAATATATATSSMVSSNKEYARREDYSDYKPMSWKCKCGPFLFNP